MNPRKPRAYHSDPEALPIYPSPPEVTAMIRAAKNERDAFLIDFLFCTGARITEAIRLRAGDFTGSGVRLLNEKQRRQAEKHVFLPPADLARFKALVAGRATDAFVFLNQSGNPISRRWGHIIVSRAARAAGVLKLKHGVLAALWPHALRHGNAIHLLNAGVPVNSVSAQLGHRNLASTAVYLAIADPDRRRAMAGVSFQQTA